MALVVFLRGINVGGHRTFQPSHLAKALAKYDVVNVGAAGNFVVRKPISQARLRAELLRRLPFQAEIMICSGRDLIDVASRDPFAGEPSGPDIVRFVSILAKRPRALPSLPLSLPPDGEWLLRIIAVKERFAFGLYRRQMRTISYLNQIDKRLGVSATTRNWNTINAIVKILKRGREDSDR
jgi:uncharacterized protein (DUF1697 family)